jgi:hypothetical protein
VAHAAEHEASICARYARGDGAASATAGDSRHNDAGLDERLDGLYRYGGDNDGHNDYLRQPLLLSKPLAHVALYMLHVERGHTADVPLHRDG